MKKVYTILLLLFSTAVLADDTFVIDKKKYTRLHFEGFKSGNRPHLQFGGDLGINLNYFIYRSNNVREGKDVGVGYQGGFFLRVSKGSIYTQFDFNFLRTTFPIKGLDFSDSILSVNNTRIRFNSLGIPIVFGFYVYKNSLFKLRCFTGFEPYFLVKSKILYEFTSNDMTELIEYKLTKSEKKEYFKTFQLAYQLGTGFDIGMFTVDFKYSLGLVNYNKDKYVRAQTHLFQLITGIIF